MQRPHGNIRLYLPLPLQSGTAVRLEGRNAHYLGTVMRAGPGTFLRVFNEQDGEWQATLGAPHKRSWEALIEGQTRPAAPEPGPVIALGSIRRERMELATEKATELGAQGIQPLLTERTAHRHPSPERLRAIAIEAAEQCGRMTIPEIATAEHLAGFIERQPVHHRVFLLDLTPSAIPLAAALEAWQRDAPLSPAVTFIIGPEGGWSEPEINRVLRLPAAVPVSLGPRVLRSETAAMAALACYQAFVGAGPAPTS
jgi:16S rRNA (uracil1498-N3)-methyltransferase